MSINNGPDMGYFAFELDTLRICTKRESPDEFKMKTVIELIGAPEGLSWLPTGEKSISTNHCQPYHLAEEATAPEHVHMWGYERMYRRSAYIDLQSEVITAFANTIFRIQILEINPAAHVAQTAPPAKLPKGALPPPTPRDITLIEMDLPLALLLMENGSKLDFSKSFDDPSFAEAGVKLTLNELVVPSLSSLSWTIFADNDLSEYVMGSSIVRWKSALLSEVSPNWALHYADVVDPKAKIKPTPAELRAKYLEQISKIVLNQSTVAKYTLNIGTQPESSSERNKYNHNDELPSLLPEMIFFDGKVSVNLEAAAAVPVEDDIRSQGELWSVRWGSSSSMFLHRSLVRSMGQTLLNAQPSQKRLRAMAVKYPTPEGAAAEGAPVTATGTVDVSSMDTPGGTLLQIETVLVGDGEAGGLDMKLSLELSISRPLIAAAPSVPANGSTPGRPADIIQPKKVSAKDRNRDAMKEFQDEIREFVTAVAREYVAKFPDPTAPSASRPPTAPPSSPSTRGKGAPPPPPTLQPQGSGAELPPPPSMAERKAEFMHYLSTSGIYHALKEKLKPRIQRLVRYKFGARGQALSRAENTNDCAPNGAGGVDQLLGDLYVMLVRESNAVLNSMFSTTMVDREKAELEQSPLIDDVEEAPLQAMQRLLNQARDAEADGRFDAAEQFHLERVQLLGHNAAIGSEPASVHEVYLRLGEFYLARAAACVSVSQWGADDAETQARQHFARGRQALEIAYQAQSSQWRTGLILASTLTQQQQPEEAETLFLEIIESQLRAGPKSNAGGLTSMNDFTGYETDKLSPADPLCYSVLASFLSLKGEPLKARKALVLATRSYAEAEIKPDVSTHGVPRRTAVLCLAQAAEFLFSIGCNALGHEALRLAVECEKAVTEKAEARGLPGVTVPFIRHTLRRAESRAMLAMPSEAQRATAEGAGKGAAQIQQERLQAAVRCAEESSVAAVAMPDIALGYAAQSAALAASQEDLGAVIDSTVRAFQLASEAGTERSIELSAVLRAGKLLLHLGRYAEALALLFPAGRIHTSSSALLLLIGICCLRLERLEDAEDALLEANVLDNRNPEVWAYISLMCLSFGPHRAQEAEAALRQANRLTLTSPELLRELAASFMSVDKLLIAEDLIRRSIALESGGGERERAHPRTHKLLADILAGQNQVAQAVTEYQGIMADDVADLRTKKEAGDRCIPLLASLGRDDEAKALKRIVSTLNTSLNATVA